MTKKKTILAVIFIVVVGWLYWYVYKDSFEKPGIRIGGTTRPSRSRAVRQPTAGTAPARPADYQVHFSLVGGEYQLTSVKVVSLREFKTNRFGEALWELVSDSNSTPTRAFTYGGGIRGMRPIVASARPATLVTNVPYRIVVQAGKLKGEWDFVITPDNHVAEYTE